MVWYGFYFAMSHHEHDIINKCMVGICYCGIRNLVLILTGSPLPPAALLCWISNSHPSKLFTRLWLIPLSFIDPLPPDRPTVQFNNPGQSFTVSWNNITSPFNGYNVTVSPSNPCIESPNVGCNTAYVCSGWSASNQPNMFEFSVSAVCGSVVGSRSAAASFNLQGNLHCFECCNCYNLLTAAFYNFT